MLAALAVVGALGLAIAPWLADRFLVVKGTPARADFLIVLGGESKTRAPLCAELFTRDFASVVLISGADEWEQLRTDLLAAGISESAIRLEKESTTTLENARFSFPLLRESGAKSALLVTSRYHTRRALATFRAAAPDIEFHAAAAPHVWETYNAPWFSRYETAWREFTKVGWYWLRHGISPFFVEPGAGSLEQRADQGAGSRGIRKLGALRAEQKAGVNP